MTDGAREPDHAAAFQRRLAVVTISMFALGVGLLGALGRAGIFERSGAAGTTALLTAGGLLVWLGRSAFLRCPRCHSGVGTQAPEVCPSCRVRLS